MTGAELAQRTDQVLATLDRPEVLEQIAESLPENVTMTRFVRIAKTAIRSNPKLVQADQTTLFSAIIQCAQSGLYPDQKEAALVIYGDKVSFLPMIDGVSKRLAEFGWLLRTGVVREADEFEWSEEPQSITHRPPRPGIDRGELVYAYGIATHADGRRLQRVLDRDDIAKRRKKAQTQAVWNEWEEAMWRKSAGHAVGGDVPLSEGDRARLDRILLADIADPIAALYGGTDLRTGPEPASTDGPPNDGAGPSPDAKTEEPALAAETGSSNDIEEGEWSEATDEPDPPTAEEVEAAGATTVPGGSHLGETLAQVAETDVAWLRTQLKRLPAADPMRAPIETYVRGALPETWAKYTDWKAGQ